MVVNASGRPNTSLNLAMRCLGVKTPVLVLIAGGITIYNSHTNGQKLVAHSNAGRGKVGVRWGQGLDGHWVVGVGQ